MISLAENIHLVSVKNIEVNSEIVQVGNQTLTAQDPTVLVTFDIIETLKGSAALNEIQKTSIQNVGNDEFERSYFARHTFSVENNSTQYGSASKSGFVGKIRMPLVTKKDQTFIFFCGGVETPMSYEPVIFYPTDPLYIHAKLLSAKLQK